MLFTRDHQHQSREHSRLTARYEIAYTSVDFLAALLFIVGSIFFFSESTTFFATWLFLIGSLCFALKPTLRLIREIKLARLDELQASGGGNQQATP
ncbi:YrhK family protein [Arthrobacter rhombi]|uniref:YrhK domain-containing protein n=1 Tax=Arthrobacter rhombi TaxID=71253 RepID=A0A1R4EZ77_9MICC|nr:MULTISPECIES: YrhK family protein [Micrococcaceae]PCC24063.1 hypothetical protein CIK75_15615 [Glutamicibacter sp. BW78]SJM48969.1 hypothetical protein FM101_01510 [Arthrobacter rhombi]